MQNHFFFLKLSENADTALLNRLLVSALAHSVRMYEVQWWWAHSVEAMCAGEGWPLVVLGWLACDPSSAEEHEVSIRDSECNVLLSSLAGCLVKS